MDWTEIVKFLGGTAIVVGALVYLAKTLFEHALSLNAERFRAGLQIIASERESESRNRFAIGATSLMADTAFNKHVEFCEKYSDAMDETMYTLFREGPTKNALAHAGNLAAIRVKHSLWLNPELETELGRFEGVIREIGAKAWLIDEIHGDASRPAVVQKMYSQFAEAMGLEKWDDKPVPEDLALKRVKAKLRQVLGIEELTHLRTELVRRALKKPDDS